MALPGMDLQSQYNQTLQNTIGQSQAERLRQTRQQQSLANTDWSQRGVGEGAKRMAGFQEVNPSQMPNMSGDTRSFIQPLLGNYQEGGKQVEGYYGKDNPYTQGGLETILTGQGYARAPSSLGEQFKSVGLKLPNAYGQDYYNASHEDVGNKISAYHNEVAQKQQQYNQQKAAYTQHPAFDYTKYSDPLGSANAYTQYADSVSSLEGELEQLNNHQMFSDMDDMFRTTGQVRSIQQQLPLLKQLSMKPPDLADNRAWNDYLYNRVTASTAEWQDRYEPAKASIEKYGGYGFRPGYSYGDWNWMPYESGADSPYEAGSGRWLNSNGSNRGLNYTPSGGFWESDFDSAPSGFNKWMPGITLGVLGGMFGGAGAALGGAAGSTGAAVGQAIGGALPSTIATGAQTGDWGKALGTGAVSALGGGLAGMYGGDLSKLMNMSPSAAQGLIKAGVGLAGNGLMGKEVNWKDALANAASGTLAPIMGNFAGEAVGGDLGKVVGGAATKFTGSALNNILKGKDLDIGTAISTLQGAAGGLGGLFSNTKDDKQSVNGPTSLARTLQGVKNGPAATSRRT